jgi:hypothetical protein
MPPAAKVTITPAVSDPPCSLPAAGLYVTCLVASVVSELLKVTLSEYVAASASKTNARFVKVMSSDGSEASARVNVA